MYTYHKRKTKTCVFDVIKDFGEKEDFYRIQTNFGERHLKKLKFQIDKPLPDTLRCRIKNSDTPSPIISQDITGYVNEFYADGFSRGETFEFKVVSLPDRDGFYHLMDDNGLSFRLRESQPALAKGQSVKCKFEYLDPDSFTLRRADSDMLFPMVGLHELARAINFHGVGPKVIEKFMRTVPELSAALAKHDNGQPDWILDIVEALKTCGARVFAEAIPNTDPETVRSVITACHRVLLHLLQGSGFLRNIKGAERSRLQEKLTTQIEGLDVYRRTLELLTAGKQDKFIKDLLHNLKESGYLYHPVIQLSVMMLLYRMSPELVNTTLGSFFDALMGWSQETWQAEPFRRAFVDQLEIFIDDARHGLDNMLQPESPDEYGKVEKVLTAIAIQHALASADDAVDIKRNRAVFYRLLSMLRPAKADVLLQKSFLALQGVRLPVDFTWTDIKEPTMMMTRATVDLPAGLYIPDTVSVYRNEGIEIEVSAKGISISREGENVSDVVPNGTFPWLNLSVLATLEKSPTRAKLKSMDGHDEMWSGIENALFVPDTDVPETVVTKRRPEIDDTVRIVIDRVISDPHDAKHIEAFECHVVDEHFIETEGILYAQDLVRYNLHDVTVGTFCFANGKKMEFDALVEGTDDLDADRLVFSLYDTTQSAVRDLALYGEETLCVVTKDNGNNYSAISEKGYGLFVYKRNDGTPPFRSGNVLRVRVMAFINDAVQAEVVEGPIDVRFSNSNALHHMLLAIAVNNYDTVDDNDIADFDDNRLSLSAEQIREIVQILRYKARSTRESLITAFDYLGYAALLATAINDTGLAAAIKAHKQILLLHDQYAKNRRIFRDDVLSAKQTAPDSTLVKRLADRLLTVSCLDHSECNADLWETANNAPGETDRELARAVLSYNLLSDLGSPDESADAAAGASIKQRIAGMLNVCSEQSTLKYYGSESQFVEYKSSLVYPARKGKSGISAADPDAQEFEILHIIAGFLNTEGGTLYIGVGDDHYERGLEEDFSFYKLDRSERNNYRRRAVKSLDNMANYLQQRIDEAFSLNQSAGDYAVSGIDDESSKGVVTVKIKPCPRPVYLDNTIYVRHGSKTTPLTKQEEIDIFLADREMLYRRTQTTERDTAPAVAATDTAATPAAAPAPEKEPAKPSAAKPKAAKAAAKAETEPDNAFTIATSEVRPNILLETDEGYLTPALFIRMVSDKQYSVTDNCWCIEPQKDRLALAITDDETSGYLLLVYEGEYALKVPIREILEKPMNKKMPRYSERRLVFACPVAADGGLYSLHANANGSYFERVTPIDRIKQGTITSAPERFMEPECAETSIYEVVPPSRMPAFAQILSTSFKRTQIGALAKGTAAIRTSTDEVRAALLQKLR